MRDAYLWRYYRLRDAQACQKGKLSLPQSASRLKQQIALSRILATVSNVRGSLHFLAHNASIFDAGIFLHQDLGCPFRQRRTRKNPRALAAFNLEARCGPRLNLAFDVKAN